jgi:hypothetical protein
MDWGSTSGLGDSEEWDGERSDASDRLVVESW